MIRRWQSGDCGISTQVTAGHLGMLRVWLPMREEAAILKEIVIDLLNMYKKRKNRLITNQARYLELKRFKSFPSVIKRSLQLRHALSTFALRRKTSLKSEELAELMVTSVFLEYMAQKALVKRDEKGFLEWVLPECHEDVEEIVDQFFRYLYDGVEVVRVGFEGRYSTPFFVIRPVGMTPPSITLVDDIAMDCFDSVYIEHTVSAAQPFEAPLQEFSERLQYFLFAISIAFPGYVRFKEPRPLSGRAWQTPPRPFQAARSEFLLRSEMQFEPTKRNVILDIAAGTTVHMYVPDDLEVARKAYLLTTTNFMKLDENTKNTFLRAWRRKLLAAERKWHQDRLIDYIIILETLLNAGDELRFRTSLYTSAALGITPEQKEKIFNIVYKAYSYRNKIVHGAETDEIGNIADECEDIVCSLLLKFLEWGKPIPQVQEMLLQKVIRGQ